MSNKNKEILDEKLKKISGGFQTEESDFFHKDKVIINDKEARILNIPAGKYARDDLEDLILEKTPYEVLSSDIRRHLRDHKNIDDMRKILRDDFHFKQE